MTNNDDIFAFVIDDGDEPIQPYGGLLIAKADVWNVAFGFNKQDLLDVIYQQKENLPQRNYDFYERAVHQSSLPFSNSEEVINIDGYVGLRLARATKIYDGARGVIFKPGAGWPLIERIPKRGLNVICNKIREDELSFPEEIHLFNLLVTVSDGLQTRVDIVNSHAQLSVLMDSLFVPFSQTYFDTKELIDGALLPEISTRPPVELKGAVADFIHLAFTYENIINKACQFGTRPWMVNSRLQ